jgi:TolA-binding protein
MPSRTRLVSLALAAALLFGAGTPPAHAVNKDLIQLQAQVQQLQDALARLQQSNDESMGVLKDLVQQTADSVNKMSIVVNGLQLKLQNQQEAAATKSDQLSGQIQSLNDSLDELKARMGRMEKALGDVQSAQQTTNAVLGNLPQGNGGAAAAAPVTTAPPPAGSSSASAGPQPGTPLSELANSDNGAPLSRPAPVAGPSAGELYRTAYGDYMSGKDKLAASEFQDLIKAYPDDNLSGNAFFYIGEIDLHANHPSAAIHDYDRVLEHYPDNSKIPAAHLHKGDALIAMHQTEAGIRELRALIQRFPNSPEAAQAHAKISAIARR